MKGWVAVTTFILVFAFMAAASIAQTGPANIIKGANERRETAIDNATGGFRVEAQAGNVTALFINSTRVTNRWQGYYGNISGVITLDDANNNTLYNWQIASPQGEIYASNGTTDGTVAWSRIFCVNYTNNMSAGQPIVQAFNGTDLERMIGAGMGDRDNHNATFNSTFTGSFQVGSITINSGSGCRQTNLFSNDNYQTTDFGEVLLTDNVSIIYTAILEQDAIGFQGAPVDFQLIVGENGDQAGTRTYYFFVELS
jgi:hypothetical protein